MPKNTFKVGTNIPRAKGEKFYARPVAGGALVLVKVIAILGGGLLLVKLIGG
jgi:hypothetical protein